MVTPDEIRSLYADDYAASYDQKFLHSFLTADDMRHECDLLRLLLARATRWLDVACGTGFFLSRFPDVERTGIDLSPGMLARARSKNSEVTFREHDYRDPIPEYAGRFDLVSCMWYAYSYTRTIEELTTLIDNLTTWTSATGACFVPLADPDMITGQRIPYRQPTEFAGELSITGILWSYAEDDGTKVHRHLLSPNVAFMRERFEERFRHVELVRYPAADPSQNGRPALIAWGKRDVSVAATAPSHGAFAKRLGWPTLDIAGNVIFADGNDAKPSGMVRRTARRLLRRLS